MLFDYTVQVHELKTWPEYWEPISIGNKTFEIRLNDRNYKVGDYLQLSEFEPGKGYTGRSLVVKVTYILSVMPFVPEGYVCMGIKLM